ncbi:helix-turn-helix domain-containing protein [Microbacterium sp. AGC62]|uniref:helix-turn-helix domain-containing protein n=1 Tax=Microbacterium TaxID=33882 RepID=UPI000493AB2C|nr:MULTISPECIES: helix-turn-helix domain-containing protein [unclassified Microbacterium]PRB60644.1 transcriptional regulator [Microbacterium sp. MYb45]
MTPETSIADVILHPVRIRIVQQLGGRDLTTAELRDAIPDVSQPTLYRHVAALIDAGVLAVAKERKVRGTTERTLTLGDRMAHVPEAELQAMSDLQLRSAFLTFLGDLAGRFDRFADQEAPGARGFLGFGSVPLYVDEAALEQLQAGLATLIAPYTTEQGEGRRRVGLSMIVIPED